MDIKNSNQIDKMRIAGKILANTIKEAKSICVAGISTIEVDNFIEKYIYSKDSVPSFKNFKGYPYSSCICINDEIVHTFPSERILKNGDIVSLDIGVYYEGYHSDSAITFGIGEISKKDEKLISVTKNSLLNGIELVAPDVKIGDIQAKIQETIEKDNFFVVRDLSGHGIGRKLQEPPSIPNLGVKGTGFALKEGMTFCLEPMVSTGTYRVRVKDDGWSIVTLDGSKAAHFEHTILVTKNGHEILTAID